MKLSSYMNMIAQAFNTSIQETESEFEASLVFL